jgi:hypothetical protein
MRPYLAVLVVSAALGAACSKADAPMPAAQADAAAKSETTPHAAAPKAPADEIRGTVAETLDSGGYTYLRLTTPQGEQWAAVREANVATGETVGIADAMLMENFESPTLKRKFDRIYFGSLAGTAGAAPAANPHGGTAPPAAVKNVKVDKAQGGHTVAEVHAQRKALADKDVVVRATVVKFLPGIMGKNWVHLRDGSGSAEGKDDDLTVTTQDTVAVGSVVTARGRVHADKDFGSGYAYSVIVEDARFTTEPR